MTSTNLSLIKNNQMSPAEYKASIIAAAKAKREGGEAYTPYIGGVNFIKVNGQTGDLTYGKDKHPVPAGQRLLASLGQSMHGCVEWKGSQVVNRRIVPYLQSGMPPSMPPNEPRVGDLPKPQHRDGWTECVVIPLVGIGGELDKLSLSYEGQNQSQLQAGRDLLGEMTNMTGTAWGDEGFFNALVEINVGNYLNKNNNNTIYFPVFNIVGWSDGETIREIGSLMLGDDSNPLDD